MLDPSQRYAPTLLVFFSLKSQFLFISFPSIKNVYFFFDGIYNGELVYFCRGISFICIEEGECGKFYSVSVNQNWFFNSEVDHDFEQFIILMPGSGVFRGGPS